MRNKKRSEQISSAIDIEQAYKFLGLLDPEAAAFTIQTFDDLKKRKLRALARVFNDPLEELTNELTALQERGAGVFITINETNLFGRRKENMLWARGVWQDDDDCWQGEFPLEPTIVVESSPGKYQRYWLLRKGEELSKRQHAALLNRLVQDYGCDKGAKGFNRVMRLPGFFHQKGKPFLVRIVEASGKRYTRAELLAAFPPLDQSGSPKNGSNTRPQSGDSKPSSDEIADALSYIPAEDRQTWLDVGMALHDFSSGGSAGYTLWDEWSQRAPGKYNAKNQKTTWNSFKGSGHTIRTVFELAKQNGADLRELSRKHKVSPSYHNETQQSPDTGTSKYELPDGFRYAKNGDVEYRDGEDEDDAPVWNRLCSPLRIVASTRDSEDKNHGLLLRIKTCEGRWHEWSLPMEMLAGSGEEYRRPLLSLGLRISAGTQTNRKFHELLSRSTPFAKALNVNRIGWHGPTFILPDEVYGEKNGERVVYQSGTVFQHAFRVKGTLAGWRVNVARLAIGNSRLIVAISTAFAAPLLKIVGMESGGLHWRGGTSCGKTTLLIAAGSVWGGGGIKGYITSWRATDNGLESVAVSHSDALLCMDELAQVGPDAAADAVYMLGNEQGKQRSDRLGHARPVAEWRLLYLSTGEITLVEKVSQSNRNNIKVMAGQQVRFLDMNADAGAGMGVFENCHECGTDSRKFADLLQENAELYYGTAARAFLEKLTGQDLDKLREKICTMQNRFVEDVAGGKDGQIQRAARRFALIAAAGELATEWGITGWPRGEALAAAKRCFHDWLEKRGSDGPAELIEGMAQVRSFIEANGKSRFENYDYEDVRPIINRVGFRRKLENDTHYYIFPEAWKKVVCKGFDHKMIARALFELGILVPSGEAGHLQKKVRLPGMKNPVRCYVLNSKIMEDGDDEQQ